MGQRAASCKQTARAVRHRSFARRHHERPGPSRAYELHPPRPGVKMEKNHRASSNNIARRAQGRTHPHPRARSRKKAPSASKFRTSSRRKVIMARFVRVRRNGANSKAAQSPSRSARTFYGHPIVGRPSRKMPHCLIAGSTGSGKSVCINSIISRRLLYRFSPDQLRFVMIDPKVVELQQYNALPHLVVPVVTDPKKSSARAALGRQRDGKSATRFFARVKRPQHQILQRPAPKGQNSRRRQNLNCRSSRKKEKVEPGGGRFRRRSGRTKSSLPRDEDIVIPEKTFLQSLSSLTNSPTSCSSRPADVENGPSRASRRWPRAAGIHCIVATQRPSVDVITGVIKAKHSRRAFAFQVAAKVDSRTILDAMGPRTNCSARATCFNLPPGSGKLIIRAPRRFDYRQRNCRTSLTSSRSRPSRAMRWKFTGNFPKPSPSAGIESGIDEDEENHPAMHRSHPQRTEGQRLGSCNAACASAYTARRANHGRTGKSRHRRPQQRCGTARHPH